MKFTPVKTPKLLKRLLPNLIWHIPSEDNTLYLTFDDGPTPEITDWVLDLLKAYDAKATFFCIGNNVEKYPEIYHRILSEGHRVGNHTQHHIKGWKTSSKDYIKDIHLAEFHIDSNLFRPPYGQIKPKQAKRIHKLGYTTIMWTILSVDWDAEISNEQCASNVIHHSQSGDIVVFHDSVKASSNMQYALPKVLDHFKERGFVFKRIPESIQ